MNKVVEKEIKAWCTKAQLASAEGSDEKRSCCGMREPESTT